VDGAPIVIDDSIPLGYKRRTDLQAAFLAAAERLRVEDGYVDPPGSEPRLIADLALEGGGVKGIGLVGAILVLSEAGYTFRAIAGTSAGAIAAALTAAITQVNDPAKHPMSDLRGYLRSLNFAAFMPEGPIHHFLDHHGGKVGSVVVDAAILSHNMGLYSGDYLRDWLAPILNEDLGITTFGDLALQPKDHPESLPEGHNYRLLVHTSDITRAELARLPWDYNLYGVDPAKQDVIDAVRASMSIPFFFEPVTFTAHEADADIPAPNGGKVRQHFAGGTVTWVDGGMLRNFPIDAFDRSDGGDPRWPTIGIKLSALETNFPSTTACQGSAIPVAIHCLRTMMNEWDAYQVDEATAGRTIFVNNDGLTATDFNLTPDQQTSLFINGVTAATDFVIQKAKVGHVPRSDGEGMAQLRRALANS
jgi:NTE family protein